MALFADNSNKKSQKKSKTTKKNNLKKKEENKKMWIWSAPSLRLDCRKSPLGQLKTK